MLSRKGFKFLSATSNYLRICSALSWISIIFPVALSNWSAKLCNSAVYVQCAVIHLTPSKAFHGIGLGGYFGVVTVGVSVGSELELETRGASLLSGVLTSVLETQADSIIVAATITAKSIIFLFISYSPII